MPPIGGPSALRAGPPTQVDITVQDTHRGLANISVRTAVNCTVNIPSFARGTTYPCVCTATKIDQSKSAQIVLRATNTAGCDGDVDPVVTVLEITEGSRRAKQTFADIPQAESFISVQNGNPGLKRLYIKLNGEQLKLLRLKNNDEINLHVPSFMVKGDNTVTLVGFGKSGSSALVVIADSTPSDAPSDTPIIDEPINEGGIPRKKRRAIASQIPSHVFQRDREMRTGVNMVWGNQVEP